MLPGQILNDKYKIIDLLKPLNYITVYKGSDLKTGIPVIIKELTGFFPNPVVKQQALEYFKTQAKRHFRMSHPCLPKYKDYFDFEGKRYLILDYFKGKSFKELIDEGQTLTVQEIVSWTIKICEAFSYLHNLKPEPIIFKNLNPENIIVMFSREIKLLDLGSYTKAYAFESDNTCFSSPEQYGGTVDLKTDIYSLGAVMYYLLTRQHPPDALDLEDDPILLINNLNRNISPGLKKVILKAMAIQKEDRYVTVELMKTELQAIMQPSHYPTVPLIHEKPPAKPEPVKKPTPYIPRKDSDREHSSRFTPDKTVEKRAEERVEKRRDITEVSKKYHSGIASPDNITTEKTFKKPGLPPRLPSGVKRLREKKKIAEEKLESITEKLEKEITFKDLRPENKDLKATLSELRSRKRDQKSTVKRGTGNLTEKVYPQNSNFPGATDTTLPEDTILRYRYKIMDIIITTPLSITYRAMDTKNQEFVMVKELVDAQPDLASREQAINQFKTEAKILFKLVHPNLPVYKDYFDYRFKRYLVMEYIDGCNFKTVIETSYDFIDEVQIIEWAFQICGALHYLHTLKPEPIIFRNLKPENIMLQRGGVIKLVDFGISKFFEKNRKTLDVAKIINRHFSPIEQYNEKTDERTDIYSLGAFLYYLATRTMPTDSLDVNMGVATISSPRKYNPGLSEEFEYVILKCLKHDREERYQTTEELNEDLRNILMNY